MKNSKQVCLGRGLLSTSAVIAVLLVTGATAHAQQTTGAPCSPSATTTVDGKYVPSPAPPFAGEINMNVKDSKPCWPPNVVPPKGAPNVLLIMTDDQGYGITSTFGGVIPTPAMDRIAKAGLRYTQFHSTALCSPTRAALITGRNHHSVGFGVITEQSTGYPGYDSVIGRESATIGEILKENGYSTRRGSARITTPQATNTAWLDPMTNGRAGWASIISMASWAARPTSGRPISSVTILRSNRGSGIPATTSSLTWRTRP